VSRVTRGQSQQCEVTTSPMTLRTKLNCATCRSEAAVLTGGALYGPSASDLNRYSGGACTVLERCSSRCGLYRVDWPSRCTLRPIDGVVSDEQDLLEV
jgi:hypothetical protein